MANSVIQAIDVKKEYVMGTQTVHALRGVSFEIMKNEYVAIMGPSGSGKSTMMNVIGCLDTPSSGSYILNGTNVNELTSQHLTDLGRAPVFYDCLVEVAADPAFKPRPHSAVTANT